MYFKSDLGSSRDPVTTDAPYIYYIQWYGHLCVLGKNSKLGLSGRPSDFVGVLTTSKLYTLGDQTLAFFPQVFATIRSQPLSLH